MSKYLPLAIYLAGLKQDHIRLSFSEIEQLAKLTLPRSAYTHGAWWANSRTRDSLSWLDAEDADDRVIARALDIRAIFLSACIAPVIDEIDLENKAEAAMVEIAEYVVTLLKWGCQAPRHGGRRTLGGATCCSTQTPLMIAASC